MVLLRREVLARAGARNGQLRAWLTGWAATVERSEWRGITEVRATYPIADGVTLESGTVVTIFNVQGNRYRLLTWIDYGSQTVEALDVLTHAEYDKDLWKARY